MQVITQSLRPSERTEIFLQEYVAQHQHLPGDRLPSPRKIAQELGVSESTVRSVVREWLKAGKLRSRQGSGIFISHPGQRLEPLRIGANVRSRAQSAHGIWHEVIYASALEAIMKLGPKAHFSSLYSQSEEIDALSDETLIERCRTLDGFVFNQADRHLPVLVECCKRYNKPFVYLNPPSSNSVSNFVTLGHYEALYNITRALRDTGRKRFLMLIYPNVDSSAAIRQRLYGVICGLGETVGNTTELRIQPCDSFSREMGYHGVKKLVASGYTPDAVLSAGDGLSLGALDAFREMGLSVPEDVSVIAGAGHDSEVLEESMTTIVHPLEEMGRNLASMLLEMLERKITEVPGRFIPIRIRLGRTTRPAESHALSKVFGQAGTS